MKILKSLIKIDIVEPKLIPPRYYHFIFLHSSAAFPMTCMIMEAMQNNGSKRQSHIAGLADFKEKDKVSLSNYSTAPPVAQILCIFQKVLIICTYPLRNKYITYIQTKD